MPGAIVHLRVTKGTLRTTRWLATMATSKPSSCRRRRSRLRLISCGDMEHHSFDHMDGLAGEQRTLGPRRRTLAVADGERDLRTRRRGLESQLEDRKSVVSGKSVSVRVDLGGRRLIKKKKRI